MQLGLQLKLIKVDSSNLLIKNWNIQTILIKANKHFNKLKYTYIYKGNYISWTAAFQADRQNLNGFIILFNLSFYLDAKESKFQNWHTINTGATDHFLLAAQKAELDFSQAGIPRLLFIKVTFPLSYQMSYLESVGCWSGIHLTYMHIIKGEA